MGESEVVLVQATRTGVPVRVSWRGHTYQVLGCPTPWIDRVPWWTWTAEQLPKVVEQAMWTVTMAARDGGATIQADLSVTGGDWWQIERVNG